ncbi:MAG TPA: hypothetical protein VM716_09365 [Gemmatimonadales bacterium]|nr:hypothetical protein [Gemmatimonadales bacterium]
MKTPLLSLLALLVAGCHFDKLLQGANGGQSPVGSTATRLSFTTQPSNGAAGAPLSTVRVAAEDAGGHVVSSFTSSITVSLQDNPGGATLSATVTAANGVATFSGLEIDKAAQGYTLSATASGSGLTDATSTSFDIAPGPASMLVFNVQPSNTAAGATITPPVQVWVFDNFGNQATTFTGSVTIAIGNNGGLLTHGKLSGNQAVSAVNGVATFSNLSIDAAGNGYTLMTNITGVSKESTPFNITVL